MGSSVCERRDGVWWLDGIWWKLYVHFKRFHFTEQCAPAVVSPVRAKLISNVFPHFHSLFRLTNVFSEAQAPGRFRKRWKPNLKPIPRVCVFPFVYLPLHLFHHPCHLSVFHSVHLSADLGCFSRFVFEPDCLFWFSVSTNKFTTGELDHSVPGIISKPFDAFLVLLAASPSVLSVAERILTCRRPRKQGVDI